MIRRIKDLLWDRGFEAGKRTQLRKTMLILESMLYENEKQGQIVEVLTIAEIMLKLGNPGKEFTVLEAIKGEQK